jgi:hypothetical protein
VSDRLTFAGEEFGVADRIGLMPLMRFAHLADGGVDSEDMSALAAMYDLLEQCIDPVDWQRFQRAATKVRADGEALMGIVKQAIEVIGERPTGRPSDSSDGPTVTEPKSVTEPGSSGKSAVVVQLESKGRADMAQIVAMAERARSAS